MGNFGKHGHVVVLLTLLSEVSLEDIFHTCGDMLYIIAM